MLSVYLLLLLLLLLLLFGIHECANAVEKIRIAVMVLYSCDIQTYKSPLNFIEYFITREVSYMLELLS